MQPTRGTPSPAAPLWGRLIGVGVANVHLGSRFFSGGKPAIVDLHGNIVDRIPHLPKDAFDLAVSPAGTTIAFAAGVGPTDQIFTDQIFTDQIFTVGIDGGHPRQITLGPSESSRAVSPSWSPDGSMLAYLTWADIYVVDADGTRPRRVAEDVNPELGIIIAHPKWSPDGRRILFSQVVHHSVAVRAVDVASGEITTLAGGNGVSAWGADWSPDGSTIAFSRSVRSGSCDPFRINGCDIWVMDADGANQRPLVVDKGRASLEPAWSPDGTQLAYWSIDNGPQVYVADAETGFAKHVGSGMLFGWLTPSKLIVKV